MPKIKSTPYSGSDIRMQPGVTISIRPTLSSPSIKADVSVKILHVTSESFARRQLRNSRKQATTRGSSASPRAKRTKPSTHFTTSSPPAAVDDTVLIHSYHTRETLKRIDISWKRCLRKVDRVSFNLALHVRFAEQERRDRYLYLSFYAN